MSRAARHAFVCLVVLSARGYGAPARVEPEVTRPVLDPNAAAFPAADLADFTPTLDAPAGKHGFLFAGTDGHFYFEDGRRGRFWGINVAKDAVFVPKEVIDQAADCIAAAGFDLVRLHHVDGATGLLPPGRASMQERLDPAKLDLLFYWIQALKRRGIYVYLDLLDFREFQAAEGVAEAAKLDRAAKPAAVFNERLVELQIQYARDLLFGQANPYTGFALGADPAVVMVELCDENGLFRGGDKWAQLPAPYVEELTRRWGFWLRATYSTTEGVRAAWTGGDGRSALAATEHLEDSSVRLLPPREDTGDFPSPTGQAEFSGGRSQRDRDVARFFNSVHAEYFTEVKRALRAAGLKVPLTAVTEWDNPADLLSVADNLDFVGCNWYYDHPVFAAGRAWHLPSFFCNSNPIGDEAGLDFTSSVLRASAQGKPLVVREWGVCWPSKFRGAGLLEAAAYAALQDIDGLILFTYDTQPGNRRIEYFDVSADPVRWGLVGVAGAIFRHRLVVPAARSAALGLARADVFAPGASPPPLAFRVGWVSRLRQLFFDQACDSSACDATVAGPGWSGSYPGPRVVLPVGGGADAVARLRRSGYALTLQTAPKARFAFDGSVYDPGQPLALGPGARFGVPEVQAAGYRPVGVSEDGAFCLGFRDPQRRSFVLTPGGEATSLRAALDLLAGDPAPGKPAAHAAVDQRAYTADTGQIVRLVKDERVLIDAPTIQAVAGAWDDQTVRTSDLTLTSPSPIGVVAALSLDGKPLRESETFLLKMVTVAANTGERKAPREAPPGSPAWKLEDFGVAPVETRGEPSDKALTVDRSGNPLVRAFLVNGTWEAVHKGRGWYLWCDTPGARFSLPGLGPSVQIVPFIAAGAAEALAAGQPFVYPKGCLFLRVLPGQ